MLSLQNISDRLELQDLTYVYASAIDDRDFETLTSAVFTSDAHLNYSSVGGPVGTIADLLEWAAPGLAALGPTHHMMANHQFSIDGDHARGRVMCYNPLPMPKPAEINGPGAVIVRGLYYIDHYVRTQDGWRISSRTTEDTYCFVTPPG